MSASLSPSRSVSLYLSLRIPYFLFIPLHPSLSLPFLPLSRLSLLISRSSQYIPLSEFSLCPPPPLTLALAGVLSLSHPGAHKNENGSYSAPNGQVDLCRKRQKFSFFRRKLYASSVRRRRRRRRPPRVFGQYFLYLTINAARTNVRRDC